MAIAVLVVTCALFVLIVAGACPAGHRRWHGSADFRRARRARLTGRTLGGPDPEAADRFELRPPPRSRADAAPWN